MRRAILVVLDGCGAGAAPDWEAYADLPGAATVRHVWEASGGFPAPNLTAVGFLAACGIGQSSGRYGRLRPLSAGKDSVTGHWEMMGVVLNERFSTYPHGFPPDLIAQFEAQIGTSILGNLASSGTEVLTRFGEEHLKTGYPIVYTSADSVFQIAAHESVVPVPRLYEMCHVARDLSDVQRVIARPFLGSVETGWKRTERRRDFPMSPPPNLVDQIGDVVGIGVVPELFGRGFRPGRRTQSNREHEAALLDAMAAHDSRLIFANFEDFDMLYGHRNDPTGFAKCLEAFDLTLGRLMAELGPEDLLILTADHGNDPTDASTDHNREYVPYAIVANGTGNVTVNGTGQADYDGLARIGTFISDWLQL